MASFDVTDMALAAVYAQAGLGQVLIDKGVLTDQEVYQGLHNAVAIMKSAGNANEPNVRAILRSLYPAAGL